MLQSDHSGQKKFYAKPFLRIVALATQYRPPLLQRGKRAQDNSCASLQCALAERVSAMNILETLADPNLFQPWFAGLLSCAAATFYTPYLRRLSKFDAGRSSRLKFASATVLSSLDIILRSS